jgi:hypothetical protein
MPLNVDIITRLAKGSPLTVSELDLNFENLKTAALNAYSHAEEVVGGNIDWSQISFSLDGWTTSKDSLNLLIDFDIDEASYDANIAASLGAGQSLSLGGGQATSFINAKNSLEVNSTQNDGLNLLDLKVSNSSMFAVDKDGIMFLSTNSTPSTVVSGAVWFDGSNLQLGISS